MKKIISVLVVLAMLMAMAPMVLAATETGGFMLEGGTDYTWTPEFTGTASLSGEPSVNIMVDGGNTAMGFNPTFDVVAGQSYTIRHFGEGFAWIAWEITTAGGAGGSETSGVLNIESYSSADWTAPQDGNVKFTISVAGANVAVLNGYTPVGEAADSVTVPVTAGTTYSIYPGYNVTTDCTVTWEYVEGGSQGGGNQGGGNLPANNELALGDNNVALTAGDADGETFTFTATETGNLTFTVTALAMDTGFGSEPVPAQYIPMAMGQNFALMINDTSVYDVTTVVPVTAGEVVTIQWASPMMRYAAEATFNLSVQGGGAAVEGSANNPFIIDSLPATINGTFTEGNCFDGLFYQHTVTEAGTISAVGNGPYITVMVNGEYASLPAELAVGDVLVLNPWAMSAGDFTIDVFYGTPEPNGTMDYPYVIESLPFTYTAEGSHDVYYTYTPAESGTLKMTYPAGNYVSGPMEYEKLDEYYLITVTAGEPVIINPWGDNAGNYVLDVYTGGNQGGGNQGGGQTGPATPVANGSESVASTGSIDIPFTPDADGILSVTISADTGYKIWVYNAATDETIGLPNNGTAEETYQYELTGGVGYLIKMVGYYNWGEADATITYDISFASAQITPDQIDIDKSNVVLELGENNVDLLANTVVSLFDFVPAEAGVYKFTVPAGVTMAQYGYAAWNLMETAENGILEVVATAAEQTIMIGLTSDASSVNVKVEKTGEYTAPQETIYQNYTQTTPVDSDFEMPQGTFESIDITQEQTIVLGNDGYYHLGTFDGPVILVNLNSDGFTLATLYDAGAPITMRGEKYTGQDGKIYCYDYMSFITGGYYDYSRINDYHPLNADLMAFFQDYGTAQGWYMQGLSNFAAINAGGFNEESAWLVAMGTVAGFNGSATSGEVVGGNTGNEGGNQGGNTGNEGGNTGNQGGNTGTGTGTGTGAANPNGGDFGVIAAAIAMGMSAICGTAVIVKKKEN